MRFDLNGFEKNINKKIDSLSKDLKPVISVVYSTSLSMSKRIFDKGENFDGSKIGQYSTNALYVNPKNSRRNFPTKGKTGKTKFKNGKQHKTGYFANYLAFKKAIGMATIGSNVNLQQTKNFRRAFVTRNNIQAKTVGNEIVIDFGMSSSEANPDGKIKGLAEMYPNAFKASEKEKQAALDLFEKILFKKLK